jgi:hypothetical protein
MDFEEGMQRVELAFSGYNNAGQAGAEQGGDGCAGSCVSIAIICNGRGASGKRGVPCEFTGRS